MPESDNQGERRDVPWQQRLYENVWLLAILAVVFWAVSYVVWGLMDIFTTPAG